MKLTLSPFKPELPRDIVSTYQHQCVSQGRMGALREGSGRGSAITGVMGDGLYGRKGQWWLRARALEPEVPEPESTFLLAVTLCRSPNISGLQSPPLLQGDNDNSTGCCED